MKTVNVGRNQNKTLPWYLSPWFIAIMAALWMFIIPGIIAIILLVIQMPYMSTIKDFFKRQDYYEQNQRELKTKINKMEEEYEAKEISLKENLEAQESDLRKRIESLKAEEKALIGSMIVKHYDFSDYDGITSEECKNKLALLRQDTKELIQNGKAVISSITDKKVLNNNIKQIIRCFNAECDNVLFNLSVKNIDASRKKIAASYEAINKIFEVDHVKLTKKMLELKLEELNLVYTYELKREEEREIQKAIREQMIEEEKVRKEIELQKKRIEKDQSQCSTEINRLMKYLQKTANDAEKQLYIDKIKELEDKLKELESEKETVLEREANARAGYVYIISNIGSFGEDIYKIGMTRRLEPMDRIKELSSASVPFEFDVHAMIFSTDAPDMETSLHNHFRDKSVNKVNYRKEFFKVSLSEIEDYVKGNFSETTQFTQIPVAAEYRETLRIEAEL